MPARHVVLLSIGALACAVLSACVTPNVLRPDVAQVRSIALVSLYATRSIGSGNLFLTTTGAGLPNDAGLASGADRRLADEVIALESGDVQGALEQLFGRVVGPRELDAEPALRRLIDASPAAHPDDDYTQVDGMLALDLDDERAPAALAALARAAHLDAAIAVRHEFFVVQETQAILPTVFIDDRVRVLAVDDDGVVVWSASAFGRAPLQSATPLRNPIGLRGMVSPEQWTQTSRRAFRAAWSALVHDNPHLHRGARPGGG